MVQWYLPTLGEIIESGESTLMRQSRHRHWHSRRFSDEALQKWYGAIAALNEVLASQIYQTSNQEVSSHPTSVEVSITPDRDRDSTVFPDCPMEIEGDCIAGLVLSGPFPVLAHPHALPRLAQWTLTNDPSQRLIPRQLPSAEAFRLASVPLQPPNTTEASYDAVSSCPTLSLHPDDPLGGEPFCLVLTPTFSVVLTLSLDAQYIPQCFISFDPAVIWQSWQALRSRLKAIHAKPLPTMEAIAHQFAPKVPDYHLVADFHQLVLMHVANHQNNVATESTPQVQRVSQYKDQALQPEVQYPYTETRYTPAKAQYHASEEQKGPHRPPLSGSSSASTDAHPITSASEAPAGGQTDQVRYSRKPLNLNRVERLKLETVSWRDVVIPRKRSADAASPSSSVANGNGVGRTSSTSSAHASTNEVPQSAIGSDVELLKAIAHEVRTPLTTIRTLTRLLLRAKNLEANVVKRLQQIDRECTKQIDRFGLIFKAVELKTSAANRPPSPLATISLQQMVQQNVVRWQQQAQQRNLTLDVILPQSLPNVMSDPTTLAQVLTGLMDRMTHTLPAGTLIQLSVVPAGHQIKLQFWARPRRSPESVPAPEPSASSSNSAGASSTNGTKPDEAVTYEIPSIFAPSLQAVGELLMFQPETGNLSLNLDITKNLFQSLGGKLIVRRTPHKGEVLTIFLPLENPQPSGLSPTVFNSQGFC